MRDYPLVLLFPDFVRQPLLLILRNKVYHSYIACIPSDIIHAVYNAHH